MLNVTRKYPFNYEREIKNIKILIDNMYNNICNDFIEYNFDYNDYLITSQKDIRLLYTGIISIENYFARMGFAVLNKKTKYGYHMMVGLYRSSK